jgi:hypothetical protein
MTRRECAAFAHGAGVAVVAVVGGTLVLFILWWAS